MQLRQKTFLNPILLLSVQIVFADFQTEPKEAPSSRHLEKPGKESAIESDAAKPNLHTHRRLLSTNGKLDPSMQDPIEAEEEQVSHELDNVPEEGPDWVELGEGNNTLIAAMVGVKPGATVMVTFVDKGMVDFMRNWVMHCRKSGISPIVVGAMDAQALQATREFGVRTFSMEHSIESFGWGAQIGIIEGLMELGYDVLMSDVDTAWLKNPIPFFEGTPARKRADLLISSDCASCQQDETKGLCVQAPFNIGIMLWRRSELARKVLSEWVANLKKQGGVGYMAEQVELNQILRGKDGKRMFPLEPVLESNPRGRGAVVWSRNPEGLFAVGMLPACQFTHGHLYMLAEVPQRLHLDIFVVHATYQFGSGREGQAAGKRQRFREHGLWLADPDQYFTEGKFLVYSNTVPEYIKEGLDPGFPTHQAVTGYHYRALFNAAALAKTLGRILVLPSWECHCDRHWTPILPGCIMANSDLKLPFRCPMDHMLEVMMWTNNPSNPIQVRERDFLLNPRYLASNDTSRGLVYVKGDPQDLWPSSAQHDSATKYMEWEAGATDHEAWDRVQQAGLDQVRVLEFSSTYRSFCGFEHPKMEEAFNHVMLGAVVNEQTNQRSKGALDFVSWCCRNDDPKEYRPVPVRLPMPEAFHGHSQCKREMQKTIEH